MNAGAFYFDRSILEITWIASFADVGLCESFTAEAGVNSLTIPRFLAPKLHYYYSSLRKTQAATQLIPMPRVQTTQVFVCPTGKPRLMSAQ